MNVGTVLAFITMAKICAIDYLSAVVYISGEKRIITTIHGGIEGRFTDIYEYSQGKLTLTELFTYPMFTEFTDDMQHIGDKYFIDDNEIRKSGAKELEKYNSAKDVHHFKQS